MKIGSHVSIAGGLLGAAKEAYSYGANTFMIYTGAPQNTRRSGVSKLKIEEGWQFMKEHGIEEFVVHAPYIINLASKSLDKHQFAIEFLSEELRRTEALGSKHFVLHPGAFTDSNLDDGIASIAHGLNEILKVDTNVMICLETMAGKGTEIGRNFEELRRIIDMVDKKENVKICLDTCHIHDAGYDIVSDLEGVMKNFDEVLGLESLKVFHINGSLNVRGAKKDRHANIGAKSDNPKGADNIGFDAIHKIVHSEFAKNRLLMLETPWISDKENLYKEEIALLRAE